MSKSHEISTQNNTHHSTSTLKQQQIVTKHTFIARTDDTEGQVQQVHVGSNG